MCIASVNLANRYLYIAEKTNLLHHISRMLETNNYVRCLIVDFSKAFDTLNHNVVLRKLSALHLPDTIHDWIVSFLIGRQQRCVMNGVCS